MSWGKKKPLVLTKFCPEVECLNRSWQWNTMNGMSWVEIMFSWRHGEGSWNYLEVELLWIKVCSVRMETYVLLLTLCPLSDRATLNVGVKWIEFTVNLDVNPVNSWERHVDDCDLSKTILESSVCNILNTYFGCNFSEGFGTDVCVETRLKWFLCLLIIICITAFLSALLRCCFPVPSVLQWVIRIFLPPVAYCNTKHCILKALLFAISSSLFFFLTPALYVYIGFFPHICICLYAVCVGSVKTQQKSAKV